MTPSEAGLVGGRFRVLGLLGTGGTAVVYRVHDEVTGDVVALKLAHPHAESARLGAEAQALRRVDHPNVVRLLDAGDLPDGRAWIALSLVEGTSLSERVGRDGPLEPADALAVASGVLAGLTAIHAAGLVHRDVSPLNVHVAPGPITAAGVRLLDLGLAGPDGTPAVDSEEGALGNPGYVSPEQSRGAPVDARGDLYQVGATLYLALTGRAPFGDGPAEELVAAHGSSPPPVPSVARPGLSTAIDRLVVRAMLKDPRLRYASAERMRDAVLEVGDVPAPGPGTRVLPAVVVHPPPVVGVPVGLIARPDPQPGGPADDPLARPEPPPGAPTPTVAERSTRGAALTGVLLVLAAIVGIGWIAQAGADPVAAPIPAPASTAASAKTTGTTTPTPRTPHRSPTVAPVVVPDLAGLGVGDAAAALEAVGLHEGAITLVPAPAAAGTVLGSAPAAGAAVAAGSSVDLRSASGTTLVPDVRGLDDADAEAAVRSAGLVPESVGTGRAGVVASSPVAGSALPVGATVTLDLGQEPTPAPSPTPTPTPTPTPSSTP